MRRRRSRKKEEREYIALTSSKFISWLIRSLAALASTKKEQTKPYFPTSSRI